MSGWLIWQNPPNAWITALAIALAAAVGARQYVRSAAWVPAAFRGLAVFLLFLTVFEPAIRYLEPPSRARPVRIVLDDSLSMATVDNDRTAGQWLRLAAALGEFDADDASGPLREWERARAAVEALARAKDALAAASQNDPVAAASHDRVAREQAAAVAATANLLETAWRIECEPATVDALTRAAQAVGGRIEPAAALRALDEAAADLRRRSDTIDERTAEKGDAADAVQSFVGSTRFALATAAVRRLQDAFDGGSSVVTLDGRRAELNIAPAAASTPLTAAVRDACARAAAENAEGVVLISDGRTTEPRSVLAAAASTGVPVYTVSVAPEDRSPDVRVTRIEARPAVLAGQAVPLRVRVSQRNAAGRSARITLSDGRRDITRPITLGSENWFDFVWPDTAAPGLRLTVRADMLEGETRLENNSIATDVSVLQQRPRVLVLTGPGGRDVSEMNTALAAAPWIDLRRRNLQAGRAEDISNADLNGVELIVLADVPADALPEKSWAAIDRAVRTGGKSLVVLAGQGGWLAEPGTARRIAPLLPTTSGPRPAWVTPPQQVRPVPTRAGSDAVYLRLGESGESSYREWQGRPPLSRVLNVGPPARGARTLLADRTTQAPVLVEGAIGSGRSAVVLCDEIWRWSTAGAEAAAAFWRGLAQASIDMPYAAEADGLSLSPDRPEVPAGRNVSIRFRTTDPAAGPVTLSISRGGAAVPVPSPRELLPGGGRYVTWVGLPPGQYDLSLRQGTRSVRTGLTVLADAQAELADSSPDPWQLRRIADATGGAAVGLDQIDRLPDLLARRRERDERVGTYELWCSPYWFAAIAACLGLEWAWRPRAGLA